MSYLQIFFGQSRDALFCGDGWEDVDQEASYERFREELRDRLEQEWPHAVVEVGSDSTRRYVYGLKEDYRTTEAVLRRAEGIAEELYQEGAAWVVEEPSLETLLQMRATAAEHLQRAPAGEECALSVLLSALDRVARGEENR